MSDKIESKSFSPIEKTSGQMNDAPNNPAELNSFVKGLFIFFLVTSAINCLTKFATNLVHGNITLGILMFVLEPMISRLKRSSFTSRLACLAKLYP